MADELDPTVSPAAPPAPPAKPAAAPAPPAEPEVDDTPRYTARQAVASSRALVDGDIAPWMVECALSRSGHHPLPGEHPELEHMLTREEINQIVQDFRNTPAGEADAVEGEG